MKAQESRQQIMHDSRCLQSSISCELHFHSSGKFSPGEPTLVLSSSASAPPMQSEHGHNQSHHTGDLGSMGLSVM